MGALGIETLPADGDAPRRRGAVSLRQISKSFGAQPVLKDITLDIEPGEFLTILGPSGCGKSTLLRIVAGLEQQDRGSVVIDGECVDLLRPAARVVAMVFQSYALYPHLSVLDNIAMPLRLSRLNQLQRLPGARLVHPRTRSIERGIAEEARKVASTLRIDDLLDRKPRQLSGGQKQRVALGRAMVRAPRVFLMDEPLSNLDAELRVHMRAEIAQLHRRLATTFIYVTHDQAEAMTMSDRIVVMMEGVPLQVATPKAIYEDPSDLRVARFVGSPSINVLPGVVQANGSVDVLGAKVRHATGLNPGTPVQVAFRPHALAVVDRKDASCVEGSLVHVENLGADIFLHVAVEGAAGPLVVHSDPNNGPGPSLGDRVAIRITDSRVLAFDSRGQRLRAQNHEFPAEPVHA